MKAVYIQRHGPVADLKVSDVPVPSPGPGEVLVRVQASGINPSDVGSVVGRFPNAVLPRIVGRDFAGQVVEGPADLLGTEVWGSGGDLGITRDGAHAEYVAIPRQALSRRPKNLSPEQAAAAGVPSVTAFSALVTLGNVKEDEWVIVSGAAGAVGQAAVQLAHAKGAQVIALVKDSTEHWVSQSAAVKAIADSASGDLEGVVGESTSGKGADLALNGVGASVFGSIIGALAKGGRQIVYSAAGGREFPLDLMSFYRKRLALFGLDTQSLDATKCAALLNEWTPLFETGAVTAPLIGQTYPLSSAAEAYSRAAAGTGGKIVLVMAR